MKELAKLTKNELKKLLGVITLSDGTISIKNKKYLNCIKLDTIYYNKCQHDLFAYLCKKVFNKNTRIYNYTINKTKIISSRLFGKVYINELLKLSPSYQTTAGYNKAKKEFLSSIQPSLKFILDDKNEDLKKMALRIYFDFDGSITPSFKIKNKRDKKRNKIYKYYQIQFECDINIAETNPNLVEELIILCKILNLRVIIKRDKRKWSGIDGIRISELKSVKKFIEFGGPVTQVKISSKSYRLKGKTKKAVCKGVLNILNKNIPRSYYFKEYKDALIKKEELDKFLMFEIERHN